jgi:aminopeptidase
MKFMCKWALLFVVVASFDAVGQQSAPKTVDKQALAERIVKQSAGVHEGELVLINGGMRDLELLEELAVAVRKQGAFPMISIGSERLLRRTFETVPAKYDSQVPEFDLKLANMVDAIITVDFVENPGFLAGVAPDRLAATGKAFAPVTQAQLKRGVRQVSLGNGLYPTAALAERFSMPQADLERTFWEGVNVDYPGLQNTAARVRTTLAAAKEIEITNPNGTNLRLKVENRPIFTSHGIVSAEKGSNTPNSQVWLPAGEVYLVPVAGTAEGKVVVDRQLLEGKEIQGLELTFSKGKLTSMNAKAGLDRLKALYEVGGDGRDLFGFLDFGINPNVRIAPGSHLQGFMPAGMVTIGFGNNLWAGGDNASAFAMGSFLPGSTVTVDGKALIESGVLK